jgi:hypothetical protein
MYPLTVSHNSIPTNCLFDAVGNEIQYASKSKNNGGKEYPDQYKNISMKYEKQN